MHISTCFVLVLLLAPVRAAHAEDLMVRLVDEFTGTWSTQETIFPGTDREYVERGTRVCSSILDGAYIQCTSQSTAKEKLREYLFYINVNHDSDEVEIVGIYGDWNRKNIYSGVFDEAENRLRLRARSHLAGELIDGPINWITFHSSSRGWIWEVFRWQDAVGGSKDFIGIERAAPIPPP